MATTKITSKKALSSIYSGNNQALVNKIAKLTKHVKAFPNDKGAAATLKTLPSSGYTGRTQPSGHKALTITLPGQKGAISLKLLGGRTSATGKQYQQLNKIAESAIREGAFKSKKERTEAAKGKSKPKATNKAKVKAKKA